MGYKVLDCTLRDGAYVVDSKFGEKRICDIITTLENAKIDIVECGWLRNCVHEKDSVLYSVPDDAKNYLANFIALIYGIVDPDIVILGGSVALKIDGFVEEVEALVKEKVYGVMKPYINVKKSTLNEDSGLIGAAYLAFSNWEK